MADLKEENVNLMKKINEQRIQLEQLHESYGKSIQDKEEFAQAFSEEKEKVFCSFIIK